MWWASNRTIQFPPRELSIHTFLARWLWSLIMSLSGAPDGGEHDGSDLIHLGGPLTMEAVLRQLHQNFMEGRCYVSFSSDH